MPTSARLRSCYSRAGVVAVLLSAHSILLLINTHANFVTVDESSLIPAGLSHWETETFYLYRVNPPLPRMLAVVPLLFVGAKTDYSLVTHGPGQRSDSVVAGAFARLNGDRYVCLVRLARLAGIAWSILAAIVIYLWARDLYGNVGGLISLILWCFCPSVLGHAALATTDIPATTACVITIFVFRRYLQAPCWRRAFLVGLSLGLAQLTKHSLFLLYLLLPVLLALRNLKSGQRAEMNRGAPVTLIGHAAVALFLSVFVINLGYEFDGSFTTLGDFPFVSKLFSGEYRDPGCFGNRFESTWMASAPVPFPAQYVLGMDIQRRDFETGFQSYLGGEWRARGWWYYYLYGLVVKLPVGTLALIVVGGLGCFCRWSSPRWREELLLWIPAVAILLLISSETGFSHHIRYVYPMIPFVFISAGKAAWFVQPGTWKRGGMVVALLLWGVVGSSLNVPHSLSYFNELAGGPTRGHEHLIDSNIDWGQDLLFLIAWLDQHPEAQPLRLAYFSVVDPKPVCGVQYELPGFGVRGRTTVSENMGPRPGWCAVSVNFVRGASFWAPDGRGGRTFIPPHALEYFRQIEPCAKAGYSIFLYHLTLEQANAVRQRLGFAPLACDPDSGPCPPA